MENEAQKERRKERDKQWRLKNIDAVRAKAREWRQANKERQSAKIKAYHRMRKFGVTQDQYDDMWAAQEGKCSICTKVMTRGKGKSAVDHCHTSGKVRSLLCGPCNLGLGQFKDNPEVMEAAANYVRLHAVV